MQPQLSARLIKRLFRPMALRRAWPARDHQQIVIGCARYSARLLDEFRIQLLQIVEHSQALLFAEILQLIPLFAAERAGLRDVDRDRWKGQSQLPSCQLSSST